MKANLRSLFIVGILVTVFIACTKKSDKPPMGKPTDSTGTTTPGGGAGGPKTTDIYVCGADNGNPCYWKNDTEVVLPVTGAPGGEALSIVVHGTDVYVAGYANYGYNAGAVYWKNGVVQSIQPRTTSGTPSVGGYWATATAFADTSFYVATDEHFNQTSYFVRDDNYLKIGPSGFSTEYGVADQEGGPFVNSMFASGTDIYIAGAGTQSIGEYGGATAYAQFPSYYENPGNGGGEHFLPTGSLPISEGYDFYYGEATGIAVSGSDVYVCGYVTTGQYNNVNYDAAFPVYWKNDSVQFLNAPNGYGIVGAPSSLCLSGSDVYIAGNIVTYGGGYWKNGAFTSVSSTVGMNSIGVTPSGDIYLAGISGTTGSTTAVILKNGSQTTLASGGISSADQVFVYMH